jgi:hypothetical protein
MTTRRNYSSAKRATQRISPAAQKKLERIYKRWHWGEMPTHVVETDDDLPEHLVEIGLLMEFHLRPFGADRDVVLAVTEDDIPNSHVGFDADHRHQRIYFQCSPALRESGRDLYRESEAKPMRLSRVAEELGEGHHAHAHGYVPVEVKPLGHLTHLTYFTHKKGDGPSGYIHEMGEEGGVPPILCVSRDGRFWLAGGSYTCPSPGITN